MLARYSFEWLGLSERRTPIHASMVLVRAFVWLGDKTYVFLGRRYKRVWFSLSAPDSVCLAVAAQNVHLPIEETSLHYATHRFACCSRKQHHLQHPKSDCQLDPGALTPRADTGGGVYCGTEALSAFCFFRDGHLLRIFHVFR